MSEVALITGAAGGIGRAIARRLRADGVAVALLDRSDDLGEGLAIVADVSDRGQVAAAVERAESELGPLTIAVCSHGIGPTAPLLDFPEDTWNAIQAVNVNGTLFVAQEAGRRMAARGYGRIVNLSSLGGTFASDGTAGYSTSKGAVEALTRATAFELGPHGVTANAVAPGAVMTELMLTMTTERARGVRLSRTPVGRLGTVEDIATAVAYLTARDAGWVNGVVLTVDGGFTVAGIRSVS